MRREMFKMLLGGKTEVAFYPDFDDRTQTYVDHYAVYMGGEQPTISGPIRELADCFESFAQELRAHAQEFELAHKVMDTIEPTMGKRAKQIVQVWDGKRDSKG